MSLKRETLKRWLVRLESGAENIPPLVPSLGLANKARMEAQIERLKAKIEATQ